MKKFLALLFALCASNVALAQSKPPPTFTTLSTTAIPLVVSSGTVNFTPAGASPIVLTGTLTGVVNLFVPSNYTGTITIENNVGGGTYTTISSGTITASTSVGATVVFASTTGFPAAGVPFNIQIDTEIMTGTLSGTTYTTTARGVFGSTAATHTASTTIYQNSTGYFPVYIGYSGQTNPPIVGENAVSTYVADGTNVYLGGTTAGQRLANFGWSFVGDSRLAQIVISVSNYLNAGVNSTQFFDQANALLGHQLQIVNVPSTSGWRTDQAYAAGGSGYGSAIGPVLGCTLGAYDNSKWVMLWGDINGISQYATTGDTATTIWSRIKNCAEILRGAGKNVVLVSETGATSSTSATQLGMVFSLNEQMREYSAATPNVYYFDIAQTVLNPASSTNAFNTNYSADGTHVGPYGAYYAAVAFKNWLPTIFPAINYPQNTVAEIAANGNIQQLANPLFVTTTGGSCGAGVTCGGSGGPNSNGPASWGVSVTATATATVTTPADASGYGNDLQVACTFAALSDACTVNQSIATPGNIPQGAHFEMGGIITVSSGSSNCQMPYLYANLGGSLQSYDLYWATPTAGPTTAYTYTVKTTDVTQTISSPGYISWNLKAVGAGAGSCTFTISRPFVRVRFS